MATITGGVNEKVFAIPKWLGLNEHPDGDTRLKIGEASKMVNWKITRDGNLKRRPGTDFVTGLCSSYTVNVGINLLPLGAYTATDTLNLYDSASAMVKPGTIVLTDASGYVERGVLKGLDATVTDGVMTISSDVYANVSGGVLRLSASGTEVSFADLADVLAELDEGDYYYVRISEVCYAINSTCLQEDGGSYILGGYLVTAKASAVEPIAGMWTGLVAGREVFLAACHDSVWKIWDEADGVFKREFLATVRTDKGVSFFPFDNKVYILNGYEYYVYDGTNLSVVDGYRPLILTVLEPDVNNTPGAGELTGENVNLLNGKRRVWISPDGTNKTFTLPETISTVDWVKNLSTGTTLTPTTDYTVSGNKVTFVSTPARGVNTHEIAYSVPVHNPETVPDDGIPDYRGQVTGNLFAELFAGNTDTGIFIYGDGTNRSLYTGMDYDGMPRADYFPDQYMIHVGESNTPITGMIRHSGALITYKTDGKSSGSGTAWALNYGTTTLADGTETIAVTCTPLSRAVGNDAPGMVQLVDNNPVTCCGGELYQWKSVSRYSSVIGRDERNAHRISDRIQASIKELDLASSCMWDDNDNQEFYIVGNGIALVWNYALDVWYRYESFDAVRMCNFHGEVYLGTAEGKIRRLTYDKQGDEGMPVKAEWESGAMDFGADYLRKYAAMLWVTLKPEDGTSVNVCVETDRKNTFREKVVSSSRAKIKGQPFAPKVKLKAKKFVFYRLILSVEEKMPAVTVTNVSIRVRTTGYAK